MMTLTKNHSCLKLLFVIFLFIQANVSLALDPKKAITQYTHNVWQTDAGLPQNSISAVVQSLDGYLWLATQEGLARFDGMRFTVFNSRNTKEIRHSYVSALFADKEGSLWIGTAEGGLSLLK
ncbi:MAG: ligand-binding sensor domain-containing protein, partial [Candidatus Aminicenantales bacterium]